MNAAMGMLAVFFAYQGRIREASLFLIGAALFDKLDGALARRLGLTEPAASDTETTNKINLGSILDDISDAVSFCIAPAWIFYITLSGSEIPLIQRLPVGLIAWLYILMGIARLTYFTLDRSPIPGFFKGMPTPAAAMLVMAVLINFSQAQTEGSNLTQFWGVASFVMVIIAAVLMNLYPIRYLHLGRFMSRHRWFAHLSLLVLLSVFTPYYGLVFLSYAVLYTFSPLVTGRIDPADAARETRTQTL